MTDTLYIPGLAALVAKHQKNGTHPQKAAADIALYISGWALEPAQVERAAQAAFDAGWTSVKYDWDAEKSARAAIAALLEGKTT